MTYHDSGSGPYTSHHFFAGRTCFLSSSFLTRASEHVILSAAGAKDLLLEAQSRSFATGAFRASQKQVLRYARVPRASLRMTGWARFFQKGDRMSPHGHRTPTRPAA